MATKIAEVMKELKDINSELKRLNESRKTLLERKKEIDASIMSYLDEQNQPGIKFQELIVLKHEIHGHQRKHKKDRDGDMLKVLEEANVDDPKQVFHSLQQAMIGAETVKNKLKVKMGVPDLLGRV